MCLYKKHLFPKISWKPITVYKVFLEDLTEHTIYTPFECHKVSGNVIKAKYLSIPELTIEDFIQGCGVHAYLSLEEAKSNGSLFSFHRIDGHPTSTEVYECTIPPFTFYWEGKDGDIAARKIKIRKKI